MIRLVKVVACVIGLVLAGTRDAHPQNPIPRTRNPHRSGLWGEFGGGPARIRIGCGGCDTTTTAAGGGGYLRIGGTISRKVLLGIESYTFTDNTFGFSEEDTTIVAQNETVAAIVMWYPWRAHFFLKGGVGVAQGRFTVQDSTGTPTVADGTGVGITFGLGFDMPISRKFAITANIGSYITAIGDIQIPPALTIDDVIPTTYLISIGLTFR